LKLTGAVCEIFIDALSNSKSSETLWQVNFSFLEDIDWTKQIRWILDKLLNNFPSLETVYFEGNVQKKHLIEEYLSSFGDKDIKIHFFSEEQELDDFDDEESSGEDID